MVMRRLYRVIGEEITREEFAEAAAELGMSLHRRTEETESSSYNEVWANEDRTQALSYIEDFLTGLHYVSINAKDVEKLLEQLKTEIFLYDPEDLIETAQESTDHNEQVMTLSRLVLTFPDPDDEVLEVFTNYLTQAPSALLRRAALEATARATWDELLPVVEERARDDPDADFRREAKEVLQKWHALRAADGR